MKKVLHVLASKEFSGAENVALNIIKGFESNFECAYCSVDGSVRNKIEKNDVVFIGLNKLNIKVLRKVINEFNPDIIHAHDFKATLICSLLRNRAVLIAHIHQSPEWIRKINFKTLIFGFSSLNVNRIIFVNDVQPNNYLDKYIKNKYAILPNVLNTENILKMSLCKYHQNIDIVFIGRMVDIKDPIRFIKIIYKLRKYKPNIKVAMVGDGELKEVCQKEVKNLGLIENIEFRGFIDNPLPLIKSSKILVMTSKSEGSPMVMIEALVLNKPVVVSNIPSMKYVNEYNIGSVCSDDKRYVEEIIKLLNDDDYYNKIQNNIRKYIKCKYNYSKYLNIIEGIYSI